MSTPSPSAERDDFKKLLEAMTNEKRKAPGGTR
jgi:hypothetical protein